MNKKMATNNSPPPSEPRLRLDRVDDFGARIFLIFGGFPDVVDLRVVNPLIVFVVVVRIEPLRLTDRDIVKLFVGFTV
jgi:hypothetical protein